VKRFAFLVAGSLGFPLTCLAAPVPPDVLADYGGEYSAVQEVLKSPASAR
jgi:hypothetical protein